jgi:hypothetical protein
MRIILPEPSSRHAATQGDDRHVEKRMTRQDPAD